MADTKELCKRWSENLAKWAVPDNIPELVNASPWKLNPEKFLPTPERSDTPTIEIVRTLLAASPKGYGRSILDIGCGAGGISIAVAKEVDGIIGIDASREMLNAFDNAYRQRGLDLKKLKLIEGKWPEISDQADKASVVVCANVVYNVPDIEEFISALDHNALSAVVIELHEYHPHYVANSVWKHFWNVDRPELPTAQDFVEIVESLGIEVEIASFYRDTEGIRGIDDEFVESMAQRACIDSTRLAELREFLERNPVDRPPYRLIWWTKSGQNILA